MKESGWGRERAGEVCIVSVVGSSSVVCVAHIMYEQCSAPAEASDSESQAVLQTEVCFVVV